MDENPYRPPETEHSAVDDAARVGGPFAMAAIGLLLGPVIGCSAGAVGGGCLGLAEGVFWVATPGGPPGDPVNNIVVVCFVTTMLGAFCGGFSGVIIGPILGVFCVLGSAAPKRSLKTLAVLLSGVAGAASGGFGGTLVASGPGDVTPVVFVMLGIAIGAVSGIVGGAVLARALGHFAWSRRNQTPGVDQRRGDSDE